MKTGTVHFGDRDVRDSWVNADLLCLLEPALHLGSIPRDGKHRTRIQQQAGETHLHQSIAAAAHCRSTSAAISGGTGPSRAS